MKTVILVFMPLGSPKAPVVKIKYFESWLTASNVRFCLILNKSGSEIEMITQLRSDSNTACPPVNVME